MEFLMQPIRSTAVMEEVNDNDRPMEPLHYPAVVMGSGELSVMATASAEGQMCEPAGGLQRNRMLNRKRPNNGSIRLTRRLQGGLEGNAAYGGFIFAEFFVSFR